MSNEDVYRDLQKHLDELPIGFPATKSGVELRILKHIFTPEEAELATKLRFEYEPIKTIYERMDKSKVSIEELKKTLDTLVKKGGVHYKIKKGEKQYANPVLMVGMYEYQLYRLTKEFVKDIFEYAREGFALEAYSTGVSQFRIVPVEESITPERSLTSYEKLQNIIKTVEEPICVLECICRKAQDLLGEPCNQTSLRENCMIFGSMARFYIDQGWGRAVDREEALETLRKSEKDALVFEFDNAQSPDYVCSCCSCCCGLLSGIKQMPNPVDFVVTNFNAVIDADLCTGCETCIERCQLGALTIVDNISTVDLKRCVGCGNCVSTCPADAITLQKKDEAEIPPQTHDDLMAEIKTKKERILRARKRAEERRRKRDEKKKKVK